MGSADLGPLGRRIAPTATPALGWDFELAFAVSYLVWAVGLFALLRSGRRRRAARELELDPFHRAVARVVRERRTGER